MGALEY